LYLVILQSVNLQYIDLPSINRLLSNRVPWSKFEELDQILGELEEIGAKVVEGIENPISRLRIIRAGTQGRLKTSWRNLFLLLRATNGCQATDARDKVFALLVLSSEKDQSVICPEYTKAAVEVYTAVAKHLIRSEESLNVLMYFKPSELPGLPSWVPDFNLSSASRIYLGETPGKGASADGKPVVDFLNDSKIKARGWILDEVQETSQDVTCCAQALGHHYSYIFTQTHPHSTYTACPGRDTRGI
jgi:hypothetical protein